VGCCHCMFEYASMSRNVHNTCDMFGCGQTGRRSLNMEQVLSTSDVVRVAVSEGQTPCSAHLVEQGKESK
jgi:hypothetical protein